MLLTRSVFIQLCSLFFLTSCLCEDFENSYDVEDETDQTDPESETDAVDYSKYYLTDTSAPLLSGAENQGFSSPIDFAGFAGPSSLEFGASAKQDKIQTLQHVQPRLPLLAQGTSGLGFIAPSQNFPSFGPFHVDYFEEAQKAQRAETEGEESEAGFNIPDTGYISYNLEGDYTTPVKQIEPKRQKPKTKQDPEREASTDYESASGKYTDYDIGKSSSTVSQPQAPGYFHDDGTAPPTPYQKYSFQPVTEGYKSKFLGDLISTVAPFNPAYSKNAGPIESQPSESIPSHLKNKNCRRVKKSVPEEHARGKREAMNCFVCEDEANNAKLTQCSYAEEEEPKNDYSGVSERYSIPSNDGFRYKRYSGEDYGADPYEYIRKRTHQNYEDAEKASAKEYEQYKVPEFYVDGPDKSYSEVQAESVMKNPENCRKEESKGMTCTICKDPKTGGNFEQCSYTSAPEEKKYAYVKEKKYQDEPSEGEETKLESKEAEPVQTQSKNEKPVESFEPVDDYKANHRGHGEKKDLKKLIDDEPYTVPKHFAETTINEQKTKAKNIEPSPYSSYYSGEDEAGETELDPYKSLDEYHFKLFPEIDTQESKPVPGKTPVEESRKDVEEVLAEFSKKDRSACKKAEKKGMTCYLCVDQKGIQHEECMYVSESKPQASHLAYHEVQQIKSPVSEAPSTEAYQAAASEEHETKVAYKPKKKRSQRKKSRQEPEKLDSKDDPKTPEEFVVGEEEGAFSAETKPVYSKVLGVKLPRYMIEKSEFEKEFDEFAYN